MKTFDVQSVAIRAPFESVFAFIAKAENLPLWTSAFKHVNGDKALMESPGGVAEVKLSVKFSREIGTVDWYMTFQDGSAAKAYSRVVNNGPDTCIYSFILMPPPLPLEQIEGTVERQSRILGEELTRLREILERNTSSGVW